jgi:hypothetical protein
MDGEGWHYYEEHEQLKELFWEAFEKNAGAGTITVERKESIQTARSIGIALRYGVVWEGLRLKPISVDNAYKTRYLDALLELDD